MSTESNASPDTSAQATKRQRRQASILLWRLQWLLILILAAALIWLYISQQRFQNQINERLQSNEQISSRLNEMDDRLFAIGQQALSASYPDSSRSSNNQAQNQLDLLRIQTQAAERLVSDNNPSAAINVLQSLHWQLSQDNNEIAPALTSIIKQSLLKDIERLQAQSAQPSAWQLQNIAIQNIQEFLHSYEHSNAKTKDAPSRSNVALARHQFTVHETIMTLNLAIQASNMHDQEQVKGYLRQARDQLQELMVVTSSPQKATPDSAIRQNVQAFEQQALVEEMTAPTSLQEVIAWLDQLIENVPVVTPLLTTQVLEPPTS